MKFRFVIPWYGEIPGGAERECRKTAEGLAARGHEVEVWTTTIRELDSNWNISFHQDGAEDLGGVRVRRFRADVTDHDAFNDLNAKVLRGERLTPEEERQFLAHSANSRKLCSALAEEPYEGITIVIPYCFGLSVAAARIRPERTFMIPCLHDEGYARLGTYTTVFNEIAGLILHSDAERRLVQELHRVPDEKIFMLGEGVDTDLAPEKDRFHHLYAPGPSFLLAVGRKDSGKNTPELLRFFERYRGRFPDSPLRLVLIGSGWVPIPPSLRPWVRDLGFRPRAHLVDALAAADVLVQPSVHESFSLAVMESWVCGTPVLVNGRCAVTKEFVEKSDGGLWYDDYPTFEIALRRLEGDADLRKALGRQGSDFVRRNFAWPTVLDRYEALPGVSSECASPAEGAAKT